MMAARVTSPSTTGGVGQTPAAIDTLARRDRAPARRRAPKIQLGTYLSRSGTAGRRVETAGEGGAAEPTLDALNALGIAYGRSGRADDALAAFARSLTSIPAIR